MSKEVRVLVLMSTYNGVSFLDTQIESLIRQEGVKIKILIRDDGSSDGTQALIQSWIDRYPEIINFYQGSNKGPAKSFLELLEQTKNIDCEYIAFCDQDDVWLPNKLSRAVDCIKESYSSKGNLYIGSFQMTDSLLNPIPTPTRRPRIGILEAMICNIATGCTMVFDKVLASKIETSILSHMIMHDDWVYKSAILLDSNIIFDSEKFLLYRQHANNVIGGRGLNFKQRWKGRFYKVFHPERLRSLLIRDLFESYEKQLSVSTCVLIRRLTNYRQWVNKCFFLFHKNFRGQSLEDTLRAKFLILFNQF